MVKYMDVVYGAQLMTIMVRIFGGHRGIVKDPILLFTKLTRR